MVESMARLAWSHLLKHRPIIVQRRCWTLSKARWNNLGFPVGCAVISAAKILVSKSSWKNTEDLIAVWAVRPLRRMEGLRLIEFDQGPSFRADPYTISVLNGCGSIYEDGARNRSSIPSTSLKTSVNLIVMMKSTSGVSI